VVIAGVITGVAVDLIQLRLRKHDGGDDVKATLLPTQDLVSNDSNLYAKLHQVLGCFGRGFDPNVASHCHGVLRLHPATLYGSDD
jgi:hypothetical protein